MSWSVRRLAVNNEVPVLVVVIRDAVLMHSVMSLFPMRIE